MEKKSKFKPNPKLRLMNQVRQVLRYHSVDICLTGVSFSIRPAVFLAGGGAEP